MEDIELMSNRFLLFSILVLALAALVGCSTSSGGGKIDPDDCNHIWFSNGVISEPDCESEGTEEFCCVDCGETKIEYTAPWGHQYSWVHSYEPGCDVEGYTGDYECGVCGDVKQQGTSIAPVGHKYEELALSVPGEDYRGYVELKCESCSDYAEYDLPSFYEYDYITKVENEETKYTLTFDDGVEFSFTVSNFVFANNTLSSGEECLSLWKYNGNTENLVVPATYEGKRVIGIDAGAFSYNLNLKTVALPDSVLYIADSAFYRCENLTSADLGDGIARIGSYAFYECASLESVNYGAGVNEIGGYAFLGCARLVEFDVPAGLEELGVYCFEGCTSLREVRFTADSSLALISSHAFAGCTSITELALPKGATVYFGALVGCTALEELTLGTGFDSIATLFTDRGYDDGFCEDDLALIPESLKTVNVVAAGSLIEPSVISDNAFRGCEYIETVVIGEGIVSIGENAFLDCTGVVSLKLPNTLESVAENAFVNCPNVELLSYMGGKYLGTESNPYLIFVSPDFDAIEDGETVLVLHENTQVINGALVFKGITKLSLPGNIKSFGNTVFDENISLDEFYFLGTVADWCKLDFGENNNPAARANKIYFNDADGEAYLLGEELVIPDGVTDVPEYAFRGLGIKKVYLPATVTALGDSFDDGLENVYFGGTLLDWCNISLNETASNNPMYYAERFYLKEGEEYTELTYLVIPEGVSSISYEFWGFECLETIVVPSTVTSILSMGFKNCTNVKSVYYEGTVGAWQNVCAVEALNGKRIYFYSAEEQTKDDYFATQNKLWHYNNEGKAEFWVKLTTLTEGNTYAYTHTETTVTEEFWQTILFVKDNGLVDEAFSGDLASFGEAIKISNTKAELEHNIATLYSQPLGDGIEVSFNEGKCTVAKGGVSATLACFEVEGEVYVYDASTRKYVLRFLVDSENSRIYEYTASEQFTIYHYYGLEA